MLSAPCLDAIIATVMQTIQSFTPISDQSARVLILGSMPGAQSLRAGQYYAHPRNGFWRIMAELYGVDSTAPYTVRTAQLTHAGVAVWDVLQRCRRKGSLDSAIESGTRVANDFRTFFATHPNISIIGFNGSEAQQSFRRFVQSDVDTAHMRLIRLPSSSPAHAIKLETKIAQWKAALQR